MILPEPPSEVASKRVITLLTDKAALRRFQLGFAILLLAFAQPLWNLVRLALNSDIHSHTLLIPFVVAYLWRTSPGSRPFSTTSDPEGTSAVRPQSKFGASAAALLGIAGHAGSWFLRKSVLIAEVDATALSIAAFLFCLFGLSLATMGWPVLRPRIFALCFTLFFIPLPGFIVEGLSVLLQKASAEAADLMLSLAGIPQLRNGLVFKLPTITIQVAEECSGVRSTFVLLITSLVAGHMFLRTGWKRAVLALAIFPLGVLRNAFRITLLSWLSVNVDAGIIDSALHHRGGPIFFGLSLLPLFALLWLFRRSDLRQSKGRGERSTTSLGN